MKILVSLLLAVCASAATVEIRQIGPAVAHAYITGYTGSCTWNLYEGPTATGTPHPDVTASVDTSRSDTVGDGFGTRIIRLGHDYGDNFLKVNTQYTLATDASDTGCASTASVTFSTWFQPPAVMQRSFIPKWNSSTYTKTAEPSYDWTTAGRRKLYVTSPEGVPFEFFDQADVDSWYYTYPYTHGGVGLAGGATWTNAGNAINGDTTTYAVAPDTTSIVVYPIGGRDWWYSGVFETVENFGIVLSGSGSDAGTTTNRQLDFCISFQTVARTCAATGFTVTMPATTNAVVPSSPNPSNVPAAQHNAWPNEFTNPGFKGWGVLVSRDHMPVSAGIDAVVNGVVTISTNFTGGNQNYFPYTLEGNYIMIPGSSCPGLMCAVATVESPTHLTLVDTSVNTTGSSNAVGYPSGIIVKRKTATGGSTVNIGMKFVEQGNVGDLTFTNNPQCHPTATTYSGVKGHWCANGGQGTVSPFYFIADDPKDRTSGQANGVYPNTTFGINTGFPIGSGPFVTGVKSDLTKTTSISQSQDRPSGNFFFQPPYGFDPSDGNVFYAVNGCNNNASKCVFRLTIRDVSPQYLAMSQYIDNQYGGHQNTWAAGSVYIDNMTSPSIGLDISSQIAGNHEWDWSHQGIYASYNPWSSAEFKGMSGTKAFFNIIHGQDSSPSLNAVVEMTTGRVIRVFSSAYNGETGGIPELRFGSIHSAGGEQLPENTYNMAISFPSRGSNAGSPGSFSGTPMAVNILGVMRGGVLSSNTCLGYPFTDTAFCNADNGGTPVPLYDNTCPGCATDNTIPDWIKAHWTGTDEFVTMDVSTDLCLESPGSAGSDAQTYYSTCSWNAAYRKVPWSLQIGDRFTWYASNAGSWVCGQWYAGDCEILQVVKILSQTSTTMRVIVQRDSSWDYSCLIPSYRSLIYPNKQKRPDCVGDITQTKLPNGWRGRIAAGRNGGAGSLTVLIKFDSSGCPSNQTITCGTYAYGEIPSVIGYGHSNVGKGTVDGKYIAIGPKTLLNATFEEITGLDSTKGPVLTRASQGLNFSGNGFDLINGYVGKDQISAESHEQLWSLDFNHLNEPHAGGDRVGNPRNIVKISGCTNVYRISPANTGTYKIAPLIGWAGHNMMEDVSGPTANICTAHDYSYVYIQRAGETAGLSSGANGVTPAVGDIYIKLPYANRNNDSEGCQMAWRPYLNDPCLVFLKGAGHGGMRRSYWGWHDPDGKFSQFIGYGTGFPGMFRPFSSLHPTANGLTGIAHIGYESSGIRNTGLLFHLPPIREQVTHTNTMFNTTISVPSVSGATHARIKFGLDPNTFYCSGRQEACVTDSVMNAATNPYAYVGESLNPTPCASGCTIPLPLDLGRAFYYKIEWLSGGVVVQSTQPTPIVVN